MSNVLNTRRSAMGRPRAFDMADVLSSAVPIFREHGFNGASVDDLKEATGLTAGSIYKAFKDKKGFFAAALSYYLDDRQKRLAQRIEAFSTGRERVAEVLRFYLESASGSEGRCGCLVLAGLIEVTTLDEALQDTLRDALSRNRATLIAMLLEGQKDGSIRNDLEVEPCADVLLGLQQGFRAIGKLHDPADHSTLVAIALKILD